MPSQSQQDKSPRRLHLGLDCNLCQLTLFGAHALKMEVFFDGFAAIARYTGDLSIAGHGSVMTPPRLIVAACIASIMMIVTLMAGVCVLVIVGVVFARLVGPVARVCVALFIRVLGVPTMHVAGLKTLVLARGETLLTARIVGASLVFAMLTVLALTTSVIVLHPARSVGPALLQKMAELLIISLPKLVAHLALRIDSNFVELMARDEAFAQDSASNLSLSLQSLHPERTYSALSDL